MSMLGLVDFVFPYKWYGGTETSSQLQALEHFQLRISGQAVHKKQNSSGPLKVKRANEEQLLTDFRSTGTSVDCRLEKELFALIQLLQRCRGSR